MSKRLWIYTTTRDTTRGHNHCGQAFERTAHMGRAASHIRVGQRRCLGRWRRWGGIVSGVWFGRALRPSGSRRRSTQRAEQTVAWRPPARRSPVRVSKQGPPGNRVSAGLVIVRYALVLRPGVRRHAAAPFTYQTRWPNSQALFAVARIALDQKVEGSNPSSPATTDECPSVRDLRQF